MKNTNLTPIEQAREDLKQVNIQMRELESRAKFLRDVIAYLGGIPPQEPEPDIAIGKGEISKPLAVPNEKPTKEIAASEFCEKHIEDHGPARGAELWSAYIAAGNNLTGKDKNAQMVTLAGYLARVGKLKFYKDYGRWWFAERPFPTGKGFMRII